jgi:hypothetical protein
LSPKQQPVDCPNPNCSTPAALGLCIRFANGFGLQLDADGAHAGRWDDIHCLVCGHYSSPYASNDREGRDLRADANWLTALDRALIYAKRGRLLGYIREHSLGFADLLAMRHAVQGLRSLEAMAGAAPAFPHVGVLRVHADMQVPDQFGVAHGEAESEPFARKVHVLGRLLGAQSAESAPRHIRGATSQPAWFFYSDVDFIGLLCLQPNRSYRGTLTIDGCLDRLLHAS